MSGSWFYSLNEALGRVFPERRVYIRSDARTRYWTFSPISQGGFALVVAGFLGWTTLTSVVFVSDAMDGRTAENRLEASQEAYEIKLAALRERQLLLEQELNRSNARGDAVTVELSAKQRILVDTATRLQTAEAELTGLRNEFETLVAARHKAQQEINVLNEDVIRLRLSLAETERKKETTATTLTTFSEIMEGVISERDDASNRADTLDQRVAVLENEITQWEVRQETLLAQLEGATRTSLSSLDKLFVGSDINLESILKQTRRDYTGRGGGPVTDGDDAAIVPPPPSEEDGKRVAALMTDLERMSLMRVAINRLPFGMPTRGAELTSGFGPRRDPFRRTYRMHNGVDFAAPRGTPIYTTADGVVSFSGRQRGYGIVVKIRHAFGFETVYAHLSKSRVKVGQRVERGQRIADMGSTGRSTGSHLHYEVRIDGKPVNPTKFIRAARNVL
ncbi:MAG: DUF5930 domain-containing protein [Pseudomonadota bacterium]